MSGVDLEELETDIKAVQDFIDRGMTVGFAYADTVNKAAKEYLKLRKAIDAGELAVVPCEPTLEQLQAGSQEWRSDIENVGTYGVAKGIYRAAIKAAPKWPVEEKEPQTSRNPSGWGHE